MAASNIKPQLDFSWVPDSLKDFAKGTMGVMLTILVIGFIITALYWGVQHTSTNFFIRNGTAGYTLLAIVMAAALIGGLARGESWGIQNVDVIPQGINVQGDGASARKLDSGLAAAVGDDAASSFAQAGKNGSDAKEKMKEAAGKIGKGDLTGGLGSGLEALKDAAKGVGNGLKGTWEAAQHLGPIGMLQLGWNTVKDTAGNLANAAKDKASQAWHSAGDWLSRHKPW